MGGRNMIRVPIAIAICMMGTINLFLTMFYVIPCSIGVTISLVTTILGLLIIISYVLN